MISIGLNLAKGDLYYTCLEGTLGKPTLLGKGKLSFNVKWSTQEQAEWFDKNFRALFSKYKPEVIGYRVSTSIGKDDQYQYLIFPWGVLNLVAQDLKLSSKFLTTRKFTARFFKQPKPFNRFHFVDTIVGEHPPNWNDNQRLSALAALSNLND